jgi:hypothetical protein
MVKYILHGGDTGEVNPYNTAFFAELSKGLKNGSKILLNYFARPKDIWRDLASEDKKKINVNAKQKKLEFEIAQESKIVDQLKSASVMYMRGGETNLLKKELVKYKNLAKLFENKVIAGSSAGVYVLSKYYFGNDTKKVGHGLGILNLKVYCHYKDSDKDIVEALINFKEDLELLVLPNYKFQVIFK